MTLSRRNFLAGCVLLIGFSGCNGPTPTAPLATAAPVAVPAPPVSRNVVHEATVYEYVRTGPPRPIPNLTLLAWEAIGNRRVGAVRLPDITTDEFGRFRILTSGFLLFLETAPGSASKFVCPSFPHYGAINELYLVDASWSGEPQPGSGFPFLGIWGHVTERAGEAVSPVAGATVTLDDGSHDPPSNRHANGFYSICSVTGADFTRTVTARKEGYRPAAEGILWGSDFTVNFTLERN